MEVNSSSNVSVPLSPEAPQAGVKTSAASTVANSAVAEDVNEVSGVDRTRHASEFKHSGGEQYHSDGEPPPEHPQAEEKSTSDSLDLTG